MTTPTVLAVEYEGRANGGGKRWVCLLSDIIEGLDRNILKSRPYDTFMHDFDHSNMDSAMYAQEEPYHENFMEQPTLSVVAVDELDALVKANRILQGTV